MSLEVIDSIIELADKYRKKISIIPSRRQIDAKSLGGGYVNKWSTEEFTNYVRAADKGKHIWLSRDHSGPWQLNETVNGVMVNFEDAMESCKESLKVDIECGFDLIHLDASLGLKHGRSSSQILDDTLYLLNYCEEIRIENNLPEINYEIGSDEQSQIPTDPLEAEEQLNLYLKNIKKNSLPKPTFYVIQTGTKVAETRNIGSFQSPFNVEQVLPTSVQIPAILKICQENGIFFKEHNSDYLNNESLSWHRRFGINAANIAPEFGVAHTKAILHAAKLWGFNSFLSSFTEYVLDNKKWEKWTVPKTKADNYEKVIIAGHYHLSDEYIIKLVRDLDCDLKLKGVSLGESIKGSIKNSIDRYLQYFGYGLF